VFDRAGIPLSLSASLSSTRSIHVASRCVDGDITTFCHTGDCSSDMWLRLAVQIAGLSASSLGRIVIINRNILRDRILGGEIHLMQNESRASEVWSSVITDNATYSDFAAFTYMLPQTMVEVRAPGVSAAECEEGVTENLVEIAEIEVNGGSLSVSASQSTTHSTFYASKALDGDTATFTHTKGCLQGFYADQYFRLHLDSPDEDVTSVKVTNRVGVGQFMPGNQLSVLKWDHSNIFTVEWHSEFISEESVYDFTAPTAVPSVKTGMKVECAGLHCKGCSGVALGGSSYVVDSLESCLMACISSDACGYSEYYEDGTKSCALYSECDGTRSAASFVLSSKTCLRGHHIGNRCSDDYSTPVIEITEEACGSNESENIINLSEVESYDGSGTLIPLTAELSSVDLPHTADRCVDGNDNTFCHTGSDTAAGHCGDEKWLRLKPVNVGGGVSDLARIIVKNRLSDSGTLTGDSERIIGATLRVFADSKSSSSASWSSSFASSQATYTFDVSVPAVDYDESAWTTVFTETNTDAALSTGLQGVDNGMWRPGLPVRLEYGGSVGDLWIEFIPSSTVFLNKAGGSAQIIPLIHFDTNDITLKTWVEDAGGAIFCIGGFDTAWAVKDKDDTRFTHGCNSVNWQGRGAFYGTTHLDQNRIGGWVGRKADGENKGNGGVGLTIKVGRCTPGTFYSNSDEDGCTKCPAGYSNPNYGSMDVGDCLRNISPKGTFSPKGSSFPTPCPEGTFNTVEGAGAQNACIACPTGTYALAKGQTSCVLCPPGSFSGEQGSMSCTPCPAGSFSPLGARSCWSCAPGTYSRGAAEVCLPCDPGSATADAGSTQCSTCADDEEAAAAGMTQCSAM